MTISNEVVIFVLSHTVKNEASREMAIKSAMNKKDYDYVIKLTLDGEDKDKSLTTNELLINMQIDRHLGMSYLEYKC